MNDIDRLQRLVAAGYEVRFAKLNDERCQAVIFDEHDKFAAEGATVEDAFANVREEFWREALLAAATAAT